MAPLLSRPMLNSFGCFFIGHFSVHRPHPVHRSILTFLAFLRILTVKFPTKPETSSTSLYVCRVIFSWAPASTIRGVKIHAAQSKVGNVLSNCAILPPMVGFFSTISTGNPASATSSAVWIPAIPPPMTRHLLVTSLSPAINGLFSCTFAMAALARTMAFAVASSISL